jgi:tetratricopeptide (TPR) repeat protein
LVIALFNYNSVLSTSGDDSVATKERLIIEDRKVKLSVDIINLTLAWFASQDRQFDEVKLYSDRVTAINPRNKFNLALLVRRYVEHKDFYNSLKSTVFSVIDQADPSAQLFFGIVCYYQGKIPEAKECFNKALQESWHYPVELAYRTAIHFHEGEYQEAYTMSQKAIAASGSQPDPLPLKVKADASYQLLVNEKEAMPGNSVSKATVDHTQDIVAVPADSGAQSRAVMPPDKHPYWPRGGRAVVMPSLKMQATDACKRAVSEGSMRGDQLTIYKKIRGR